MTPAEVLRLRARQLRDDAAMANQVAEEAREDMQKHQVIASDLETKALAMESAAEYLEERNG